MLKGRPLMLGLLISMGVAFLSGAVHLLQLRLARGDVFPPYSSLRSDPLGCKILYESLGAMGGVWVARNYRPWNRIEISTATTLFLLGFTPQSFAAVEQPNAESLQEYLRAGGRVVIAFRPDDLGTNFTALHPPDSNPADGGKRKEVAPAGKKKSEGVDKNREDMPPPFLKSRTANLGERFGVEVSDLVQTGGKGGVAKAESGTADKPFPNSLEPLSWHKSLRFDRMAGAWKVVYRLDASPVVVERSYGRGSLVLCADSYAFSNESVFKQPAPNFLVWCMGSSRRFIFDETHLGVLETPGIVNLVRKYNLHGIVFGFVVLALLFVWKNAFPLVAAPEMAPQNEIMALPGREGFAGMVSLLRRSIPPRQLMQTCFDVWLRHSARANEVTKEKMQAILRATDGGAQDSASVYRQLQAALHRKTGK